MQPGGSSKNRVAVKVRLDHNIDGAIQPLMFRTEDGPVIRIDKVLDVRKASSLKAGGSGMRYTCHIQGREIYLFYEMGLHYWYVEREQLEGAGDWA